MPDTKGLAQRIRIPRDPTFNYVAEAIESLQDQVNGEDKKIVGLQLAIDNLPTPVAATVALPTTTYVIDPIVAHAVTIDFANGDKHEIDLPVAAAGGSPVTINAVVWTGGALLPGAILYIKFLQPIPPGGCAVVWDAEFAIDAATQPGGAGDTYSMFVFIRRLDNKWELLQSPLLEQPAL